MLSWNINVYLIDLFHCYVSLFHSAFNIEELHGTDSECGKTLTLTQSETQFTDSETFSKGFSNPLAASISEDGR